MSLFNSIGKIFNFYMFYGKRARKTKIFIILSFLPVVIAIVMKIVQTVNPHLYLRDLSVFNNIIMFFYLQFLILILALFFGSSVCLEELEGKTLTYLTTRPVSKSSVILGKYSAYTLMIIIAVNAGVILSFLILNIDHLLDASQYKVLLKDTGVLTLGLICYTSFFTFLGTFLKKPILFGLVFSFGWENIIQYFPGSTQRFTIAHYLKSLLPQSGGGRFSFLLVRLEASPPLIAILILLLITAVFLGLAVLLFSYKEYILEE